MHLLANGIDYSICYLAFVQSFVGRPTEGASKGSFGTE